MLPALIAGPVIFFGIFGSRPRGAGRRTTGHAAGMVLCILLAVGNLVFGTSIATSLIYRVGVAGAATITASHATSTQYNNYNVRGYTVLIRAADGKVIETGFQDDDFNVYPWHNGTVYPGRGDTFTCAT